MFTNLKNLIRHTKNKATPTTDINNANVTVNNDSKHYLIHTENSHSSSGSTHNIDDNENERPNKSSDPLPVYSELGSRYTIICEIGEGAFSKVYKAHDNQLKIYVAIKVIDKTTMKPSQVDSILKEVAIMRRLDHPNIVKLHNFINTPKYTFLVIEYITGGELFNQIVKYTYFSEELSRHIIIQVVKAVDYLHSEVGVVHRDIKPENLLFQYIPYHPHPKGESHKLRKSDDSKKLDEGVFENGAAHVGQIKLADFGLSKVLWDSNTKTPCGTASYTAPEIVKDESYSKSVDMWAVGCVLYTLLSGFPPFYDTDPKTLTLKDLVSHLLTVDPLKRYTPEDVLKHPWILMNSKPTNPASDAPLYTPKNNESILKFEETIPILANGKHHQYFGECRNGSSSQETMLSPRAEALKFAFDTGMSIQRTTTPLRRLIDNDDYFNESDDEDSDENESLDSSEEEDDDDSNLPNEYQSNDSEDESDSDLDSKHFVYSHSPTVKKLHTRGTASKLTPYVKKLQSKMSCCDSGKDHITTEPTVAETSRPVVSYLNQETVPPPLNSGNSSPISETSDTSMKSNGSYFKEMDSFKLNMDQNTLLNRRKMSNTGVNPRAPPAVL
ncbi:hypothetical protein WICPIJ_004906 [Wickerhamomyces pijperi]|uniref:Protein kinase domain-containing protein n=1 Tax=Wickerhamomyces pijperi TaxID=599730 RepID=A0A9P8TMG0_WICPI|nr:hypothetical protein WICPIJ_004906 [Wickerhamomyces pijperi]